MKSVSTIIDSELQGPKKDNKICNTKKTTFISEKCQDQKTDRYELKRPIRCTFSH